ncbi:PLP-dependent transferase [Prochlorococcus sp. MIT 1307]|uniref:PLP-dependent transferase n=1 Tax=Prochlorococcus sp. MIT 1307 TaxID=3096219 RepID=UPI002A7478E5|nr:PLP-dependent transferase [Prochlorococcus sp. MIT 1307]
MSPRNLLTNPCWSAKDLGQALPDSPHAVSVALPRWKDVIAYEEKDPSVLKTLRSVYPRFGLNPLVLEVAQRAHKPPQWGECSVWPYPDIKTAEKARNFCHHKASGSKTIISEVLGLHCLIADAQATNAAKAFWQHTGLGASSRLAAIALNQEKAPLPSVGIKARSALKQRLAEIYCCPSQNIELHPSGMAALARALEAITTLHPNRPTLQLGFPYVDVLKLPQTIFEGSDLCLKTDPTAIEAELQKKKPAAVIVELPSNPMLQCIDLLTVSKLAHERGIPVIADDTIGSAVNINALPYADLIFSSLTKSFAGRGDILAGALVISPESHWSKSLKEILTNIDLTELSDADAVELEETSRDVKERLPKLNRACLTLKTKLEAHPAVARVLHPEKCPNFQALMRPGAGHGCLLSFELVGGLSQAKRVYDTLEICKGPSLGTNFTLACPYVLLAHYQELIWASKCGVPTDLLRVSVGLEKPDKLWERFEKALQN